MAPDINSLLPAFATICVALFWRRIWAALATGVVVGIALAPGLLSEASASTASASLGDVSRLKIILFVMLVGALLEMLSVSGATIAFADALETRLTSPRRARMATWGLSMCLFFDDYANVLISGSAMKDIALRKGVRAALMAYMVDVIAILASVMLVSTWSAFEGATMAKEASGLGHSNSTATELFLGSLPYHFYTYFAISLTLAVAWSGRWFGANFDNIEDTSEIARNNLRAGSKPIHLFAPLATLVLGAITGLLASGAWFAHSAHLELSLMNILGQSPAIEVLVASAIAALAVAFALLKSDKVLPMSELSKAFGRGALNMVEIGAVILLATALSHLTSLLGAGAYLAHFITQALSPEYIPLAVYVLAMSITASTGFSWGSMAIVMPVAFSLAASVGTTDLIPILSAAVITGAVSGEHMIPFSEKAVLSATACGIPAIYHFKTHILQSIAAFLAGALGFALVGHHTALWLCFALPAGLLLAFHLRFAKLSMAPVSK